MGTIIRALIILLFWSSTCFSATTYYVKDGGNDASAGTSDGTAWAHCPGLVGWTGSVTLTSGDTVYFRSQDTWTSNTVPFLTAVEGVTYDGKTYGSGTRATLQDVGSGDFLIQAIEQVRIRVSNVTIRGFVVDGNNQHVVGIFMGYAAPGDTENVTVDDCIVKDHGKYPFYITIPSASVTVSSDATYTYFTKDDAVDWYEDLPIRVGCVIRWTGFTNPLLNAPSHAFTVVAVTADQIKVAKITDAGTETTTVTGTSYHTQWGYSILVGGYGTTLTNVIIKDTEVTGRLDAEGLAIYPSWGGYGSKVDNVLVRNCYLHDNGACGLAINNDADNVTIEFCTIDNNGTYGIYERVSPGTEGPGNVLSAPNNMVIRNNIISRNGWYGIQFQNARNFVTDGDVYNNIFYNNGDAGGGRIGADLQFATDTTITYIDAVFNIYNNTFYSALTDLDALSAIVMFGSYSGTVAGGGTMNFKNNIIYSAITPINDYAGVATHSNNIIYRSSGAADYAVEGVVYGAAIAPVSVTLSNDATHTYFTKSGGASFVGVFAVGHRIKWAGFTGLEGPFLNMSFRVNAVSADVIEITPRIGAYHYSAVPVTGITSEAVGIPSANVCIWESAGTKFTKVPTYTGVDWTTLVHVGETITWTGFENPNYNGIPFTVTSVGRDTIGVALIYEFTSTATVTAQPGTLTNYIRADTDLWETGNPVDPGQDPAFLNVANLPTGFSGTYGVNMVPNQTGLSVGAASPAVDGGATLGSPYDSCINSAGQAGWSGRPINAVYDIGAYEYGVGPIAGVCTGSFSGNLQ